MEKQKKSTHWGWKISRDELKEQVENYNSLKLTQSYRGISVLITLALLGLSILLGLFGVFGIQEILWGSIIYIPILFFVYKGHRWAIVALIIVWTIDKGSIFIQSVSDGSGAIAPIIWWLIVTPYFISALRVENERRKLRPKTSSDLIYCQKCGVQLEADSKFCIKCGNAVSIN